MARIKRPHIIYREDFTDFAIKTANRQERNYGLHGNGSSNGSDRGDR